MAPDGPGVALGLIMAWVGIAGNDLSQERDLGIYTRLYRAPWTDDKASSIFGPFGVFYGVFMAALSWDKGNVIPWNCE